MVNTNATVTVTLTFEDLSVLGGLAHEASIRAVHATREITSGQSPDTPEARAFWADLEKRANQWERKLEGWIKETQEGGIPYVCEDVAKDGDKCAHCIPGKSDDQ